MASRITVATILAILISGVGHIYLGASRRGITILAVSIALGVATYGISFAMGLAFGSGSQPDFASSIAMISALAALGVAQLGFWIWQIFDVRKVARQRVGITQ